MQMRRNLPNESWTLQEWFGAADVRSDAEVANTVSKLGLLDKAWDPKRISDWRNDKRGGLINRDEQAIPMFIALYLIAKRNHQPLFSDDFSFPAQVRCFLRSKACRQIFGGLETSETRKLLKIIHGKDDDVLTRDPIRRQRQRIHPSPPSKFFGRTKEIDDVLWGLDNRIITVIDGIAGDGKTSLAWHVSCKAYEQRRFHQFDWATDRRLIIEPTGRKRIVKPNVTYTTFYEDILLSWMETFNWSHLYEYKGARLRDACVDELRRGRYLVIIDNIETMENMDEIMYWLSDILTSNHTQDRIASRAIVTSRVSFNSPDCKTVSIEGLSEPDSRNYIQYLQDSWGVNKRLTNTQMHEFMYATQRNPLFMQIAMLRYSQEQTVSSFDTIMESLQTGEHNVFNNLFTPMLKELTHQAQDLARLIAFHLIYTNQITTRKDAQEIWVDQYGDEEIFEFHDAFDELQRHRIISKNNNVSMHSLIRAYFTQDSRLSS